MMAFLGLIIIMLERSSSVENFEEWRTLAKTRFLMFCQGKVFITDLGLHKVYIIDLRRGQQTAQGYMGSGLGKFLGPAGMVCDDSGNILVADSGNNRLVVANKKGDLVRVGKSDDQYYCPCDMVRVDNTVLV